MPMATLNALAAVALARILSCSALVQENSTASPSCLVFGVGGVAEVDDCTSLKLTDMPRTGPIGGSWAVELDSGIAVDGNSNIVTLWNGGSDSTAISLGTMTTPVGGVQLNGKLYVACFGSWPTPKGDSGLAVIDLASKRLESTHSFADSRMHVHNVYAFEFGGQKEIFVANIGNPWVGPLAGLGLSRFDQTTRKFVLDTTSSQLSVRSAKQQADGSIFVLTQEPAGQATKLARLEEKSGHLEAISQTSLPPRAHGGDGGADIVLGFAQDTMFVTDRQDNSSPGLLYYFVYSASAGFQVQNVRNTGINPRYTVALANGDVVSCNQDGNDVSVYKGLALSPMDTSIAEYRIPTLSSPMFFMQTRKLSRTPRRTGPPTVLVYA